nr:ABC transporter ATP-binding protein [Ardenticatena sp.]
MIHVERLTKRFGALTAVDQVSFEVETGESVALWGANGAGKTTILRCLLGLYHYEGEVRIAGHDIRTQGREARRLLGFVPQELSFHENMRVANTLVFYARLKKASYIPDELLDRLDLRPHLHKQVRELSGGLKQRLALALALIGDPPLLLFDEPTANLDVRARDDFMHLLHDLKAAGKTLVYTSHRLEEIATLADRVLLLESGRLVADATPHRLAETIGHTLLLRVYVAPHQKMQALDVLQAKGFTASVNSHGIKIFIPALQKTTVLETLLRADIEVRDFSLEWALHE